MPKKSSAPRRKVKKTAHRIEDIRCKGLRNIGNTCYINCIVQYIVNSPVTAFFLTGLVPEDPADACKEPNPHLREAAQQRRDLIRQLDAVVHALYREERPIAPTNLVTALWKVADVPGYTMEDAHMCWLAFANCLDSIILDPEDRNKCHFQGLEGDARHGTTLAQSIFGLTVWSTVTCSNCGNRSQTNETCFDLQVALLEPGSEQSPSMTAEPPRDKCPDMHADIPPTPQPRSPAHRASPRYNALHDIDSSSSVGTEGVLKGCSTIPSQENPSRTVSEDADMPCVVHAHAHLHGSAPVPIRYKSPLAANPQIHPAQTSEKLVETGGGTDQDPSAGTSVVDALRHLCSAEEIQGFRCACCNTETTASRQMSIRKLPSQLVLHVKRFQADAKLRGHIHCPCDLDMFECTVPGVDGIEAGSPAATALELRTAGHFQYRLKAVVEHVGTRLHGGHFICYIRVGDTWNLCNDHKISAVDWDEVQQAEAYIVCYERSPR